MRKLLLVGGGEVGRGNTSYETKEIDIEAVKLAEKENPNFLFIGLASSFSDSYYDTMKKIYRDLGCNCAYLKKKNIINNPDIVKNKIAIADIIYICGGDTIKLLTDIKDYKIDSLLEAACNKGTVMVGVSAGAILLSNGGFSDAKILRGESTKHSFIKGLAFVDIDICPHYQENVNKTQELKEYLEDTSSKMYCLENCTALKIIDDIYEVIKSNQSKNVYLCTYKDGKYKENQLTNGIIIRS